MYWERCVFSNEDDVFSSCMFLWHVCAGRGRNKNFNITGSMGGEERAGVLRSLSMFAGAAGGEGDCSLIALLRC